MFFSNILKYGIGIYRATEDIREGYVNLFLEMDAKNQFLKSTYMDYLAKRCAADCQKKIAKNRSIPNLNLRIVHIYETTYNTCINIEGQIISIQEQIHKCEEDIDAQKRNLNKQNQYLAEINRTGTLPADCEYKYMEDLTNSIKETKDEIAKLESNKNQLETSINNFRKKSTEDVEKAVLSIIDLIMDLKNKIDILFEVIDNIEKDYDNAFQSYKHFLWKKIKNFEDKKKYFKAMNNFPSFSDICFQCGYHLIEQEDLFREEREYINTTIRDFFKFKTKV